MNRKPYRVEAASMASEEHPERNEDAYFALPNGIFGVFDGVGSVPGGELASTFASIYCQGALGKAALADVASIEELLSSTLQDIDRGLRREYGKSLATRDIATTALLASLVWDEAREVGTLCTAHAGDSRTYLHRDGRIIFTTLDHSRVRTLNDQRVVQDEVANTHYVLEVDPYSWPCIYERSLVTSCLSADYSHKQLHIDTNHMGVVPGDTILLSSDGIHDNLTTDEIANILMTARQPAWALVDAAQVRSHETREVTRVIGGTKYKDTYFRPKKDDMTAVVIQIPVLGE